LNLSKIAFVFPGQGAQSVGMAHDAYEKFESARNVFIAADEALGFSLSELIFAGPDTELKKTYNTQPALLTASIALLKVLQEQTKIQPDFVAGHSLGEYSALVASGAMDFADAVKTVHARGQFMEQAVPSGLGAMAAVLGGEREALAELCQQITSSGHLVQLANLNCPGQIVISGSEQGVQAVVERGKEVGAKRVIKLEVSGPFHSALMAPAAEQLKQTLEHVNIVDANIEVVANVTASSVRKADEIKKLLVDQVCSSVLWEDSVRWLISQGVDTFVEIGSGNVLTGLIKKIDGAVKVYTLNSVAAIESFVNEVHI
jgi:[acyl-carrier-protein] S-malonyltransferase